MRKLAAALLLALGFASPALAVTCGPIPALPDTERRTEYTGIVAQTGPFSVGFQLYGDSTDYGNWLSVWVNGVQKTAVTDFTVTSPSGALGTLCLPISNAVVNFVAAQTGTIEIVGARRPRRASQVSENRGVTAHDFNQIITDLTATERERWDAVVRSLRAPPGDTLTPLPPAATRASSILSFDGAGQPSLTSPSIGLGTVIGPNISIDGHVAVFSGATGAVIKDGGALISGTANPTGTIGLAAVNGVLTTAMRSDAAPALSQAIVPTWTGTHTFSNGTSLMTLANAGLISVTNNSQNAIDFTGSGNSNATSIHLNPGAGTLSTGTISELSIMSTAGQAFGGNYGRWSFVANGTSIANQFGLFGEFGGTTATGAMGPFVIQNAVENPPSTFTTTEFVRFQTTTAGAEAAVQGASVFGASATAPINVISLNIASIGSAGHRDSHAILWAGKYNNGSDGAAWWRQYNNVTSNAGASTFLLQSNLNAAGWVTRMSVTDAGVISGATLNLLNALNPIYGGTGLASFNQGDVIYASAANTLSALSKSASATRYLANTGASNAPQWDQVNLANGVTGNLPVGNLNNGTGASGTTFWRGDGTWASPAGSGTVNAGTAGQLAYYGSSSNIVSGNTNLTYASTALTLAANNIGITTTDGFILSNTQAATVGLNQWSPRLHFTGQGWKTNATAGSQAGDWIAENQTATGAANPTASLVFSSSINGGAYASKVAFLSSGQVGFGTINPGYLFQINSPSGTHALMQFTNATTGSGASAGSYFGVLDGNTDFRIVNQQNSQIGFIANGSVNSFNFVINPSGGVWIGNSAATDPGMGHLMLTSAALLGTPGAGAYEYDGTAGYFTPNASNRAVMTAQHFQSITADYTLTDNNAAQKAFNGTTNGQITLPSSTGYLFELEYLMTNTGTTSHTWGVLFGGTATLTSGAMGCTAVSNSSSAVAAGATGYTTTLASAFTVTSASTSATENVTIRCSGRVNINAGGTFIPQVQASAQPNGTEKMLKNSYFRMWPIGSNAVQSVGNWN